MQKVVVFGGSGFLGSHVADVLSERGFKVVIFDRIKSPYLREDQQMVTGDILDYGQVASAVKGASFVYNYAAIADIAEAQNKPIDTIRVNVLGSSHILEACREHKVSRIVYGSTIYVYSEQGSFYRSSKQATELFIENYHEIYGLDYTILRYGSLYGKRANEFNFINNIIRQALVEGKIERKGDGSEIRDYVNVLDAARASVDILDDEYKNAHIMLTGNQSMKVKDLLSMIKEMFDNKIEISYLDEIIEGHYEITPYLFRPKVARKYMLNYYHDLGQGILECIYDNYEQLKSDSKIKVKDHYDPDSI